MIRRRALRRLALLGVALSLHSTASLGQHRRRRHRHAAPASAPSTPVVVVTAPPAAPTVEAAPLPAPRTLPDDPPPPLPAPTAPTTQAPAAPPPVTGVSTAPIESTPWTLPWRTRPLTLPARVVRVDAVLGMDRSGVVVSGGGRVTSSSLAPWLRVGAGYGITAAVEVGVTTTPLRIEAGAQFQDAFAYGRFRLLHGDTFDLGAQLYLGYRHPDRFAGSLGALLRWRFERFRLDVSPAVELVAGASNVVDLRVPVDLWWQISSEFAVGLRTGVIAPGFTDSRLGIIAGVRAVYSLPRDGGPFMDLFVSIDAEPLIHFSGTLFRDDFVVAQLGAQAHFGP